MINKRFGKWLVLEEAHKGDWGQYYLCLCDCGTKKPILRGELSNGNTRGCLECKWPALSKVENMIGHVFGSWKVIEKATVNKTAKHYKCICKCGFEGIVRGDILRGNRSTQCKACRKYEVDAIEREIVGKKYGKWTILERYDDPKKQTKKYFCICECGAIEKVIGSCIYLGKTKSCRKCAVTKHGYKGSLTL